MERTRNWRFPVLCGIIAVAVTQLRAQTLTQGGLGSRYQQLDNSFGNPADWSRSLGVGYFNPNGIVPLSFLHVNSRFSLLPMNGSIANVGETFRTTVAGGVGQYWRMERDINQIGLLWHEGTHRAFHVQSGEQRDDANDLYSGLMLQNHVGDGLWVMNDGPPTGGRAFPNPLQLLDAKGFAGVGIIDIMRFPGAGNPRGPWSRLHLFHDVSPVQPWFAHRAQMRNGITLTGNSDHAYIGQWFDQGENGIEAEVDDNSNLVIAVSEQDIPEGHTHVWDNISFRFFSDLSGADGAASTVDGLEMMRLQPARETAQDPVEGLVGIGDFRSAGTSPDERLHLLDRTIRIERLVPDYNGNTLKKVVVTDDNGRLHWRDINTFPSGGTSCEWTMSNTAPNHVVTAYGSSDPNCPDDGDHVGIGTSSPSAKLHVVRKPIGGDEVGIRVETTTDNNYTGGSSFGAGILSSIAPDASTPHMPVHYGMYAIANNADRKNFGVKGWGQNSVANSSAVNFGLYGLSTGDGTTYGCYGSGLGTGASTYGVFGEANGSFTANTTYGVYGWAYQAASGGTNWAGYFRGDVNITNTLTVNTTLYTSDGTLKENIEDLPLGEASAALMQLRPVTYDFNQGEFAYLDLPENHQVGLIAQEVEEVLPDLVGSYLQPADMDSLGNIIHEEFAIKGINYTALIPYLIAAFQQQQSVIGTQNEAIAQLQQEVASCCALNDGTRSMSAGGTPVGTLVNDLRIVPNPVADRTELRYTLAQEGRVRLEITDASGRTIQVQEEGQRTAGSYIYEWDTTALAQGTYFCTLYINDEFLVKKSVKLDVR